jgi:hypothetical protein
VGGASTTSPRTGSRRTPPASPTGTARSKCRSRRAGATRTGTSWSWRDGGARWFVQAAADLGEGGLARTGVTADLGTGAIIGAFGADLDHGPAGEIGDVRVDGDRLIVDGTWVSLDAELDPTEEASAGVEGELRARCPADDGDTASGTAGGVAVA